MTSIVSRLCVQFTSADVVITPGVSSSSCHGPLTPYFYWTGLLFIQLILSTTSMVALDRKEISLFTLTSYLWLLNYIEKYFWNILYNSACFICPKNWTVNISWSLSKSATGLAVVYFVISAYFAFLLVSLNKFEDDEITFDDYNYGDYEFPSIPLKALVPIIDNYLKWNKSK